MIGCSQREGPREKYRDQYRATGEPLFLEVMTRSLRQAPEYQPEHEPRHEAGQMRDDVGAFVAGAKPRQQDNGADHR